MGNRKKGFSLLELLIYMAVLSIVIVGIVEIFLSVTSGRSQNEVQSFVDSNLRFAIDKIESDLRSATSITTPASLSSGGTIGSWSNTKALRSALVLHSAVVSNGYIYMTGGTPDQAVATSAVSYAQLNGDGSISNWSSTTALPSAIFFHQAATYNGYIYTTGGFNSGNKSFVYYAQLNGDGSISNWSSTTALPSGINRHGVVVNNGYIYTTGGGCRFGHLHRLLCSY